MRSRATKRAKRYERIDEQALRRIAYIIGGNSAAGRALRDADERKNRGETPVVFCQSYCLGPNYLVCDQATAIRDGLMEGESK